jgi:hypothetical protein
MYQGMQHTQANYHHLVRAGIGKPAVDQALGSQLVGAYSFMPALEGQGNPYGNAGVARYNNTVNAYYHSFVPQMDASPKGPGSPAGSSPGHCKAWVERHAWESGENAALRLEQRGRHGANAELRECRRQPRRQPLRHLPHLHVRPYLAAGTRTRPGRLNCV